MGLLGLARTPFFPFPPFDFGMVINNMSVLLSSELMIRVMRSQLNHCSTDNMGNETICESIYRGITRRLQKNPAFRSHLFVLSQLQVRQERATYLRLICR